MSGHLLGAPSKAGGALYSGYGHLGTPRSGGELRKMGFLGCFFGSFGAKGLAIKESEDRGFEGLESCIRCIVVVITSCIR